MGTLSAFRREFVLAIRTTLDNVPVAYVTSVENRMREAVYLGDSVDADIEDPTLKTGTRTRDVDTIHYVEIQVVRSYPEDAERKADDIYEAIMSILSDQPSRDALNTAAGTLWCYPLSYAMSTQTVDDGGVMSTIKLSVTTRTRRTA